MSTNSCLNCGDDCGEDDFCSSGCAFEHHDSQGEPVSGSSAGKIARASLLVAVYLEDRAYGGPEEGGWWYDTGELVRVVRIFRDDERARRYTARMNRRLERTLNKGRRPVSSVLSEGRFRAHVCRDLAERSFPARAPGYE